MIPHEMADIVRRTTQRMRTIMGHSTRQCQRHATPRGVRRAFTLIEVLVVIAVISLMIAILLPVIEEARERARRIKCASNMRQVFIGQETYASDSIEYYPGILGLGQNVNGGDTSYTASYMNPGWPAPNTAPRWMRNANNCLPTYISKVVTHCPGVFDPNWAQPEWQKYDYGGGETLTWGVLDFSMKSGFGSNHSGIGDTDYQPPIPGPWAEEGGWPGGGNWMAFRGYLDWRYPRRAQGFFLNFRRNQPHPFGKPQNLQSIMIMDRQRPPAPSPTGQDGGIYEIKRANHAIRGKPESAGCNIVQLHGGTRWMDLSRVWEKDPGSPGLPWASNYYDITGYGEGCYYQYVDDEIAQNWAP